MRRSMNGEGSVQNLWSDDWDSLGESDWEGGTKSKRDPDATTTGETP